MNVGRDKNADPKWLIPLICRLGHVTKKDIGAIRIFDRETKFEIAPETAPRFASAVRKAPEDEIRIEPSTAPDADTGSAKPHRKPAGKPGGKPFRKPYGKGAANDAPRKPRRERS